MEVMKAKKRDPQIERLSKYLSKYDEYSGPISTSEIAIAVIERLEFEIEKRESDLLESNKYWVDRVDELESKIERMKSEKKL